MLPPRLPASPHGGRTAQPFTGLDFSVNTNPYGPNPILLQAVQNADHAQYPDPAYTDVRATLADWHGAKTEEIAVAVGASDLLHRLARAFLPSSGRLLSLSAPFGELERAVNLQRAQIDVVQELPAQLPEHTSLVYVGYPHNPTGRAVDLCPIDYISKKCAQIGALLIIDEAYLPFTHLPTPPRHSHLVRVLSPGKTHGLVGVRPAYTIASAEVTAAIDNLAPAWHVPAATAAALAALPSSTSFLSETLPKVTSQANELARELARFGEVEHHDTPYMTLQTNLPAVQLAQALLDKQIKVRDCSSYGFEDRIRVSTRLPHENEQLLTALEQIEL